MHIKTNNISTTVFILVTAISHCFSQTAPGVPPEFINFANYTSVYTQDTTKCIQTINKHPAPGLLLNTPHNAPCKKFNADFANINLPGNTIPMCSIDPNWVVSNLPSYNDMSEYWYKVDTNIFKAKHAECVTNLNMLDSKRVVNTMYGLDAKKAFCKRHVEFNEAVFGKRAEIISMKETITKKLEKDFGNRQGRNKLIADFTVTATCVGTNLEGCLFMWEHLLQEKDNCVLTTMGYKTSGMPTTWLYADALDVQLLHIWASVQGIQMDKTKHNGIAKYHLAPGVPTVKNSFWEPGLVGGKN